MNAEMFSRNQYRMLPVKYCRSTYANLFLGLELASFTKMLFVSPYLLNNFPTSFCYVKWMVTVHWYLHTDLWNKSCVLQNIVSVRLVEAENLDWRLFRVSDKKLIKWFGKSCRIFELGLHLNWAMPTSLPASIVYIQHSIP